MDSALRYCYRYPRPSVTADCVVFSRNGDRLRLLLIRRANEPFKGCWAFPGGFMNMDEDAESAARRELKEETGLDGDRFFQIGAFSDVDRDPRDRVVTIAFLVLSDYSEVRGCDDASDARWFDIGSLPELAFDHRKILECALEKFSDLLKCF